MHSFQFVRIAFPMRSKERDIQSHQKSYYYFFNAQFQFVGIDFLMRSKERDIKCDQKSYRYFFPYQISSYFQIINTIIQLEHGILFFKNAEASESGLSLF